MAFISLVDVTKRYGATTAVDCVSLDCDRGEFLVILGPAGAGKTSILKMIAGIEDITSGEIFIDSTKINHLAPHAIDASMAFETYALYPHMTVFENLSFPLKTIRPKWSSVEIERRANEIAELLGIRNLLDRYPSELSGGQKQRVSLGRCLIKDPKVYLMDEPISHLDAKLRHEMRRQLKRIKDRLSASVIYVTHDYMESLSLADRIAVLNKGKIVQIGTPADLYQRPANTFVASLMGYPKINLVEGSIEQRKNSLVFTSADSTVVFSIPGSVKATVEKQKNNTLFAGIRPNAVVISQVPESSGWNKGRVVLNEVLGYRNIHHVKIGGSVLNVISKGKEIFDKNHEVYVRIKSDRVLFFDKAGNEIAAGGRNDDGY